MMNLKNLRSGIPTEEEKLSLCITAGIVLLSFQSIAWPPYFSLSNFLGFWVLGIAAISGGFMPAAAAGMVLGLLLGIREDLLTLPSLLSAVCSAAWPPVFTNWQPRLSLRLAASFYPFTV